MSADPTIDHDLDATLGEAGAAQDAAADAAVAELSPGAKVLVTVAALAAASVARKALASVWRISTGHKPPVDEPGESDWRLMVLWAAAAGAAVGVARMMAERQVTRRVNRPR